MEKVEWISCDHSDRMDVEHSPDQKSKHEVSSEQDGTEQVLVNTNVSNKTTSSSSVVAAKRRLFMPERQCLQWTNIPLQSRVVPPPRSGAASVVVQGKLYVFGGYGGGTGRLDDFYAYTFETGLWEEVQVLSKIKPCCRENNGVVIAESSRHIILFGGYDGSSWLNDLWRFDIQTKQWTCIQESSDTTEHSSGRLYHEDDESNAAAVGNRRFAAGRGVHGVNRGNSNNSKGTINRSNSGVNGKIPSRRFGYVSVVQNGKFVLWGGFDGSRWLNDMYVFDFSTKTWSEIEARGTIPSARSCPAWAKDDYFVYIQGGYDGVERKSDFFACDLSTYTWTQMPSLGTPPSPRYFHSCCLYGTRIYLYGGYSGTERLADMYMYDLETNHWSQIDCTTGEAPSGRSSLVAQVDGPNFYVFGGYNGTTVLNDFYKLRLKPIDVPPSALVNDFRRLINYSDLADVRFLVEGKEVYAHKAVMAIRSSYFRSLLVDENQQTANKGDSDEMTTIDIPFVQHKVFLKMLEFLYTDTVCELSLEIGIHLLVASEKFQIHRLKALCGDYIRRDISLENVISILITSHRHNALALKDIALNYILRNLNTPTVMAGLSELTTEPDLLLEIIRRSTGNAGSAVATTAASSTAANQFGDGIEAGDFVGSGAGLDWRR